jgi:hypothetical protein
MRYYLAGIIEFVMMFSISTGSIVLLPRAQSVQSFSLILVLMSLRVLFSVKIKKLSRSSLALINLRAPAYLKLKI